jgi:ABC-type sulfate/molybdate transport systems ATPase subunit
MKTAYLRCAARSRAHDGSACRLLLDDPLEALDRARKPVEINVLHSVAGRVVVLIAHESGVGHHDGRDMVSPERRVIIAKMGSAVAAARSA